MNLKVRRKGLFTEHDRDEVSRKLIKLLKEDNRIDGVVLVGSGAVGYLDEFSDIDLVAVVNPQHSTEEVFQYWKQTIQKALSSVHYFEVEFDKNNFLAGFLLPGCLEVDFGVVSANELIAKKEHWKVIFDRTEKIETRLYKSWEERKFEDPLTISLQLSSVWHYIIQAVVAIQRKQLWRAAHNLEEVRNRGMRLASLRHDLVGSHFREIDRLPREVKEKFENTIPPSLTAQAIMKSLESAIACFFEELRLLHPNDNGLLDIESLEWEMNKLFEEYG
jgi:predicted nucleotidyltransferase